jgi:dTDP-4-amino-4,6-dideoxygalactose transaminase
LINKNKYGLSRDGVYNGLKKFNVFARKYFYPLCSHFNWYKSLPSSNPKNLSVAEKIAKEVLCLPLFGSLKSEEVEKICDILENPKTLL